MLKIGIYSRYEFSCKFAEKITLKLGLFSVEFECISCGYVAQSRAMELRNAA
jgi:hypothetical protein